MCLAQLCHSASHRYSLKTPCHSREGGNPQTHELAKMDSCFRRNDRERAGMTKDSDSDSVCGDDMKQRAVKHYYNLRCSLGLGGY